MKSADSIVETYNANGSIKNHRRRWFLYFKGENMMSVKAYAQQNPTSGLAPFSIERRDVTPRDIAIDIEFCGVCHSDIHSARNEWGGTNYPIVPGHEIVGRITALGSEVSGFKIGDLVGVGCLVDSCKECGSCHEDLEQYCEKGMIGTYNSKDTFHGGGITYGGYSQKIVVDKRFVLRIPENLDTKAVAPLLCAGITMWSPLMHWKVKAGDTVGIIGLGGLGHMGVKLAAAMGAKVVMITTSESKAQDAKKLGASDVIISKDSAQLKAWSQKFDLIINTVPVGHDLNPYLGLLKRDATMVIVGAIEPLDKFHGGLLIGKRRSIAGSVIGGIKETQEMLDFCGKHNILPDVEMINMNQINQAYERMLKNDVKYRFVIDMQSLV